MTTDGHDAYPRAIRCTMGRQVVHRTSQYLNNRLEQDHRAVKQRYYPMRGFGVFASAARFCTAFDELRQYFRSRATSQKPLPLPQQRRLYASVTSATTTCRIIGYIVDWAISRLSTAFVAVWFRVYDVLEHRASI